MPPGKKENKRRNRKGEGFFEKLFAHTGGNPEDIEGQDWYLDSPDVKLTRVFSIVLVLHIIAVGGILAFKMIDKASGPDSMSLSKANVTPQKSVAEEKEFAAKVIAPTTSREDRHCVEPGNTLSGIAAKLGVTVKELKETNHINSPDEILPGMWLKIPVKVAYDLYPDHAVKVTTQKKSSTETPREKIPGRSEVVYPVEKGDTAWGISQKHGVNINDLLQYNNIVDPTKLQVGQHLNIPVQ